VLLAGGHSIIVLELLYKEKNQIMKKTELDIMFIKWGANLQLLKKSISERFYNLTKTSSIGTYQNLKSINILLWNDIIESQNVALLDINYKEGKRYTKRQGVYLNDLFTRLYDEYFLTLNNRKAKSNLERSQEKIVMSFKIIVLEDAIKTLDFIKRNQRVLKDYLSKEQKIYDSIKLVAKNVQIKPFSTIQENIDLLLKVLKSSELEYQRKFGDDKEVTNYPFEKQVADVEQILNRSLQLDNCNVVQWLAYINKVQEIIKQNEKNNGKHSR